MDQVELRDIAAQKNAVIDVVKRLNIRIRRAQNLFEAEGMERAEPDAFGALADGFDDAILHLAGGFVGEGEPENIFAGEIWIGFEQSANALGDDARLAGSGARDDEQGPFAVLDGGALLVVQAESFLRFGRGAHLLDPEELSYQNLPEANIKRNRRNGWRQRKLRKQRRQEEGSR